MVPKYIMLCRGKLFISNILRYSFHQIKSSPGNEKYPGEIKNILLEKYLSKGFYLIILVLVQS